jgi:hypothetical protein
MNTEQQTTQNKQHRYTDISGPDSSVGIATYYGLDGPGFEFRWGQDLSHTSIPSQPPVQWVPGLSWE